MRRLLCLFAAVVLLTAAWTMSACAELVFVSDGVILDEGPCGENLTWTLYSDGLLLISGTGRSYDYVKGIMEGYTADELAAYVEAHPDHEDYGLREGGSYYEYTASDGTYIGYAAPWYRYRAETSFGSYTTHEKYDAFNPNGWTFNRIEIDEGVTYIGDWMFYRLCGPAEIVIPEGVTEMGRYAIRYSTTLETVILPDSLEVLGDYGVSRHENKLVTLQLGSGVRVMGDCALQANKQQTELILPASCESVGKAFCNGNESLVYADLGSLTVLPDNMFTFCRSLKQVRMSDSVTAIGSSVFYGCGSLESIRIPAGCEAIGNGAFMQCDSLKTVLIDSPVIASQCTAEGKFGSLLVNCETLYVHVSIDSVGKYITASYTVQGTEGDYVVYTRNHAE